MIKDKIDLCIKELEEGAYKVSNYSVKYLNKYGFASVYFKVKRGVNFMYIPAVIVPDENEDKEEYVKFLSFLEDVKLLTWFNTSGVLDTQSIVSILKFVEYERFKLSGKKALHLDLAEYNYEKSIRNVIEEYIIPFEYVGNLKCIYNEQNHNLVLLHDDDNEYFDEAREFLGI